MCLTTSRHSGAATDETRRTGRAMAGERLAGNKSEGKLLENNSFRKLIENFSKFIPPDTKLRVMLFAPSGFMLICNQP